MDNYGRSIVAWLPEIIVSGISDPVIRIIRERTGETVYTLRISGNSFQPGVFNMGSYTIEIGDPDKTGWQKIEGIYATSFRERKEMKVEF